MSRSQLGGRMLSLAEINSKLQTARITVVTSTVIALTVNLLSIFFTVNPLITMLAFVVLLISMIFATLQLTGVATERTKQVHVTIVYDRSTGEMLQYPSYVSQDIVRQAVNVIRKHNPSFIDRIKNPPTLNGISSKGRSVFIDLAELILLRQFSWLNDYLPNELLNEFERIKELPHGFMENPIIRALTTELRNDKDVTLSVLNNLDNFYIPKGSTLIVSQNPVYTHPDYRTFKIESSIFRITINFHVSAIWRINSMTSGTPVPEIGHIPINPFFYDDAFQRFTKGSLWTASFYYEVHTQLLSPKLWLFLFFFNIPTWNWRLKKILHFLDYFINNFNRTVFGTIDINDHIAKERGYWEHKFVQTTLWQIKHFIADLEEIDKSRKPLQDHSHVYIS